MTASYEVISEKSLFLAYTAFCIPSATAPDYLSRDSTGEMGMVHKGFGKPVVKHSQRNNRVSVLIIYLFYFWLSQMNNHL